METPSLEKIFEDYSGIMYGHVVGGRFYIHSSPIEPSKLSHIKHYREIYNALDEELGKRGWSEYYTMADSLNSFKYNKLFRFQTINEVWNDKYEIMVREIH